MILCQSTLDVGMSLLTTFFVRMTFYVIISPLEITTPWATNVGKSFFPLALNFQTFEGKGQQERCEIDMTKLHRNMVEK